MNRHINTYPDYAEAFNEISKHVHDIIEKEKALTSAKCDLDTQIIFSKYFPGLRGSGESEYHSYCLLGYVEPSVNMLKGIIKRCSKIDDYYKLPCL